MAPFRLKHRKRNNPEVGYGAELNSDTLRDTAWLAIGDAAIAFDPLSSRGVFNALYTGLSGGLAIRRVLAGQPWALSHYAAQIDRIYSAYVDHLALCYQAEARWPEEPFWARRQRSRRRSREDSE